jgi:uncharacterized protein YjeT (DUF2065 family)
MRAHEGVVTMSPMSLLAGLVVLLAGLYLVGFGLSAVLVPARTSAYLHGFASSLRLHLLELSVRLVVGVAFIAYASRMSLGGTFHVFGVILVVTTVGLALLPWRWHQRIARASVPAAARFLPLLGMIAVAAGAFVVWALARGSTG